LRTLATDDFLKSRMKSDCVNWYDGINFGWQLTVLVRWPLIKAIMTC